MYMSNLGVSVEVGRIPPIKIKDEIPVNVSGQSHSCTGKK